MAMALTARRLDEPAELELSAAKPVRAASAEIDAATLDGCRRGEPLALRRFVVCYQRLVFAFLSRMTGAGPHVEDLAQEVFLRAYRALPRFEIREEARTSTWLLRIAVRLVQDERKRRVPEVVPWQDDLGVAEATPETEQRRREIGQACERALASLSDEQRVVFVLAEFHDLSGAEIAELLGVPENTVKTRLHRARERLRELLANYDPGKTESRR